MAQTTDVAATSGTGELPWYKTLTSNQWRMLLAANLGWLFDGYETYALILTVGPAMRSLLDPSQYSQIPSFAGTVISITLLGWGIGGIIGGVVADYFGRRRTMIYAILAYSIMTGLTALLVQLDLVRDPALSGRHRHRLGMGHRHLDARRAVAAERARQGRRPHAMRARHRLLPRLADLAVRLRLRPGRVALHVRHRHPAGAAHGLDQDLDRRVARLASRSTRSARTRRRARRPAPRSPRTTRR